MASDWEAGERQGDCKGELARSSAARPERWPMFSIAKQGRRRRGIPCDWKAGGRQGDCKGELDQPPVQQGCVKVLQTGPRAQNLHTSKMRYSMSSAHRAWGSSMIPVEEAGGPCPPQHRKPPRPPSHPHDGIGLRLRSKACEGEGWQVTGRRGKGRETAKESWARSSVARPERWPMFSIAKQGRRRGRQVTGSGLTVDVRGAKAGSFLSGAVAVGTEAVDSFIL